MSTGAALTIIAIALAIVAILAICAVIILIRLLLHLVQMEKNLSHEIQQLTRNVQDVVLDVKGISHRVGETVDRIRISAENVRGLASLLSFVPFRRKSQPKFATTSSTVMDWARLAYSAWTLFQRRQHRKTAKKSPPSLPG